MIIKGKNNLIVTPRRRLVSGRVRPAATDRASPRLAQPTARIMAATITPQAKEARGWMLAKPMVGTIQSSNKAAQTTMEEAAMRPMKRRFLDDSTISIILST